MGCGTRLAALERNEDRGSHDGNEVQREIEEVSDDGGWGEALKRLFDELAELGHRIRAIPGLDVTTVGDQEGLVASDEGLHLGLVAWTSGALKDIRTPSNVSIRAPSIRKFLLKTDIIVEDSLNTRSIVVRTARGPLNRLRTAA
jgi:hypothetical protein